MGRNQYCRVLPRHILPHQACRRHAHSHALDERAERGFWRMGRPILLLQHLFRCPWFGLSSGSNGAWCMQRGWSFLHRQLHRFSSTNRSCERVRFPLSSQLLGSHDPDNRYGLTDPTPGRKLTGLTGTKGNGAPRIHPRVRRDRKPNHSVACMAKTRRRSATHAATHTRPSIRRSQCEATKTCRNANGDICKRMPV